MSNTYNITFDSRFSANKSLNSPIFIGENFIIDQLEGFQVNSFQFINTIPNVRESNNKMVLLETLSGTSGTTQSSLCTIEPANYTIDTFKTALENSLTSCGNTYSVALNTMTNLLSITPTSGSFVFKDTPNNIYYEIGAKIDTDVIDKSYDLSGLKSVQINSQNFGSGYCKTFGSNYNIVLQVPCDGTYNSSVFYVNPNSNFISSDERNLRSFQFTLLDERLRIIDEKYLRDYTLNVLLKTN